MTEIIYRPEDVGMKVTNSRGKEVIVRKYHMTEEEMGRARKRWKLEVKTVDKSIKSMANRKFFNPYRRGIYYYQVQTLYLLGSNKWHSLSQVIKKMEQYMSSIPVTDKLIANEWDKFRNKEVRSFATNGKDYIGRLQENFILLQRLTQLHPYGYKLHQVCSAIDIRRVDKRGLLNGLLYYRLSTYSTEKKAFPFRDFSKFTFPRHESKFVTKKFLGTVITKNGIVKNGVLV